jgi:catechol 2,3-dioxygenase-like lactoylglutathione lyase family enzyme
MAIQLDHVMIPSTNREAAARQLGELLGVNWGPAKFGPFTSVYVNAGLTFDFDQWTDQLPKGHYCFRVSDAEFDSVLQRIQAAGLAYRSSPHGPVDSAINTSLGSRIVYWDQPDGHVWEMLTQSYARQSQVAEGAA